MVGLITKHENCHMVKRLLRSITFLTHRNNLVYMGYCTANECCFIYVCRAKDVRYNFTERISRDAYLIVNIIDMNDNVPKFTRSKYTKRIEGNKKIGKQRKYSEKSENIHKFRFVYSNQVFAIQTPFEFISVFGLTALQITVCLSGFHCQSIQVH